MSQYDDSDDVLHAVTSTNGTHALPVSRLSVTDLPFRSTGIANVKITTGGKESLLPIPILSINLEEVELVVKHLRPKVPTYRDKIKGQWMTVLNEADDTYQQALQSYQKSLMYAWILMAMDVDVCDDHNEVVWSKDNTIQEFDRARTALKRMGLVDNQALAIFQAVQVLTRDVQELLDRD